MARACHGLLSTFSNVSASVVYLSPDSFPYTTFWDPCEAGWFQSLFVNFVQLSMYTYIYGAQARDRRIWQKY